MLLFHGLQICLLVFDFHFLFERHFFTDSSDLHTFGGGIPVMRIAFPSILDYTWSSSRGERYTGTKYLTGGHK
jgi:hypothetical protein